MSLRLVFAVSILLQIHARREAPPPPPALTQSTAVRPAGGDTAVPPAPPAPPVVMAFTAPPPARRSSRMDIRAVGSSTMVHRSASKCTSPGASGTACRSPCLGGTRAKTGAASIGSSSSLKTVAQSGSSWASYCGTNQDPGKRPGGRLHARSSKPLAASRGACRCGIYSTPRAAAFGSSAAMPVPSGPGAAWIWRTSAKVRLTLWNDGHQGCVGLYRP